MKRFFSLFLTALLVVSFPAFSQHNPDKCSGSHSFSRSMLSDTLDALNYEIHLNEVNTTAKTIDATTIVQLSSKVDNLDHITLELLDLTVDEVFVNDIQVSGFIHNSPWLFVPLSTPLNTGDEVEVKVSYHGAPFHEGWGGFHFSGAYAFNLGVGFESDPHNLGKAWFPCVDDFQDRAFYEVFVTLADPKEAVCGGTRISVIDNGNGTHTYHWKLQHDIPTYLASVAIGDYAQVSDVFPSMTGADIPIEIFVRPVDSSKVEGSFQTLIPVLHAFENYFGPYAWERVGYVGTSLGAMEHTTNIAYPHSSITGNLSNEWLFAHELSHQYFGDLITCATAGDMWLNEGWAVFCESLYREYVYGAAAYRTNMRAKHKDVLHVTHIEDGGYLPLYGIPTNYTYGSTVYQKGGIVTHTLRNYLGDELFFDAVKAYVETYKFNDATTVQLKDFLSNHSGVNLNDFFDAWVFAPGFPEFSVDSFAVSPVGNNFQVTVFAKQKLKGATAFANSNKVEVTFMDNDWNEETVLMEFSDEHGVGQFTIGFEPELAMMDFYDKVADATTDEDKVIKATGLLNFTDTYAKINTLSLPEGDSALVRITHRWVAPDSLKTPTDGLRLSDYRHWRVDGIFPEGFDATGSFYFSKFNYLDNTLMTNNNDSLIILYRPDRAANWEAVDFVKTGNQYIGYIEVPHVQEGEYTLAVWEETFVGTSAELSDPENQIIVFPNPANGEVFIECGPFTPEFIKIFNAAGQVVDSIAGNVNRQSYQWNAAGFPAGVYVFNFFDKNGEVIATRKVLIN
jgi:aminopeptidase N